MTEFWFNEYRLRDGTRRVVRVVGDRDEAVRVGGHVHGGFGHRPIFRWRLRLNRSVLLTRHPNAGKTPSSAGMRLGTSLTTA